MSSIPAGSFTLFIIQCFTSLEHLKKFFWSCGIQIKFLNGDDSGNSPH